MAKVLARALALPVEDPLRTVAEASPPSRLKSAVGWRTVGRSVWDAAGVASPTEPTVTRRVAPCKGVEGVTFDLSVGALPVGVVSGTWKRAADQHLEALPQSRPGSGRTDRQREEFMTVERELWSLGQEGRNR